FRIAGERLPWRWLGILRRYLFFQDDKEVRRTGGGVEFLRTRLLPRAADMHHIPLKLVDPLKRLAVVVRTLFPTDFQILGFFRRIELVGRFEVAVGPFGDELAVLED